MGAEDDKESSLLRDLTGLQGPRSMADFLEVAFDAVVTFDIQEQITSWNPAAEKIFGWTAQEALGKTPAELFWPMDAPLENEYKNQRQTRLKRGETLQGEMTPCRKDGSSFPAQFTARATFDSDRKISGYLAVYRDLSDKVQAHEKEEQLQQSNHWLNQILTSIQDDFYVLNRDWVFVFASRTFTSRIGKEPADIVGNNIWEMFPKHIGTAFEKHLRTAMEQREVTRFEIPGKYTDAWYRMNIFPSEEGITVIGTDITEIKKAEEAQRMAHRAALQSEQRLQRVLETDAVGVLFFDPDGALIHANDVFLHMTGYTREQIERRQLSWRKMTPPEWVAESEAQMERFERTGRIGPYEKEYFLADGTRRWMLFAGRAVGDGTISEYCIDISDRKRAEAALEQSQKTFQELIERAPFGVYVIDSQFRIAHMNASSQTGAFRNVRPVVGRDFSEAMHILWPEETASEIITTFRHTLETGEPYFSPRFISPRQDVAAVEAYEWELHRMTLPDGQYGVICYYYDLTKLRDAEAAAYESEERYRRIIESTHEGIWMLDLNGITTYVNAQMASLLGYSPEEMIGHNAFEFVVPEELTRGLDEWGDRRNTKEGRQSEYQYRHKDGHAIWCLVNSSPIVDGQGRNVGILGMFTDITQRRQDEEVVRQQAHLLDLSDEAIFVWELDGVIRYWNRGAEHLYGYTNEEAVGQVSHELLATQYSLGIKTFLALLVKDGQWRGELAHRTKDGRTVLVESSQQLVDQGGRRLVLETNRDITERKRVMEALRQSEHQLQLLNESLEQKVEEKTAEVRRLAADLVLAVQRERHRVSHILHDDLQQRIYAIRMQLTFLQNELHDGNKSIWNDVLDIEKQLDEVLEITRHLSIDLSPPILQDEGLSQAIGWLAGQMRQRYSLAIELHADGPFMIPNEELQVLLFNCVRELLFNVVKHAEASRAVVVLEWLDEILRIQVNDDGKGFPAKVEEQQPAEEMSPEENLQLSFGLPSLRHQLSLFDGQMEIQSEPGAGTRVNIIVPVGKTM